MSESFEEWRDRQGDNCCLIEAAYFDQQNKINELEGENLQLNRDLCDMVLIESITHGKDIKTLQAQLEKLTRCECETGVRDWQDDKGFWKCSGCLNKAVLDEVDGE